jgi:hypothetical protein
LLCYHDDCLGRKPAVAVIKEIFEGGTEEVNDKNIVEAFLAKIIDIRNSSCFDISPAAFVRGFGILTAANKDFVCSIFIS